MSTSDLKFPSHDTAGYVGFANLPNQVSFNFQLKLTINFVMIYFMFYNNFKHILTNC